MRMIDDLPGDFVVLKVQQLDVGRWLHRIYLLKKKNQNFEWKADFKI